MSCKIDLINKINDEFSNVKKNIILESNMQNKVNELKRKRIIQAYKFKKIETISDEDLKLSNLTIRNSF